MPRTIDLYYWPTPNGKKITIFLEEVGLPYNLMPVDITAGEQFDEEFLRISRGKDTRRCSGLCSR
jgi:GSH-dependent disulfide-bond oxidoreductase